MKKILIFATAMLMVTGVAMAQNPAGPFCFDFTGYCDGLELSLNPQTKAITGFWVNWDCYNSRVPLDWGKLFNGPYGNGGYIIATLPAYGTYGFIIDIPMDGTMDMYKNNPPWGIWISGLAYGMTPGPCPFAAVGEPGIASWVE